MFSDKAVESLNKRLKKNGLNTLKNITLYRLFRSRVKERFGCNIRTFFNNVLMSASTEEVITKAIKKIKGKNMMSLYISALKSIVIYAKCIILTKIYPSTTYSGNTE